MLYGYLIPITKSQSNTMRIATIIQKYFLLSLLLFISVLSFGQQQATQFTASINTITPTSLPENSPSYLPDGSFTIDVAFSTAAPCTTATYTINATPVPNSSPQGNTPPQTTITAYIGFPAGTYLFDNAGAGVYTVTITESTGCNPGVNPITLTVLVPQGVAIPTLSEWGLIILALLSSIFGVVVIRKRAVSLAYQKLS